MSFDVERNPADHQELAATNHTELSCEPDPNGVRILALSDLHYEFGPFIPPDPSIYDVAVLAGDVYPGLKCITLAQRNSTFHGKPVVFVAGNHEFYRGERTRLLSQMRDAAKGSNVHLLDRDEVTLKGLKILGATLWTDFQLHESIGTTIEQAKRNAANGLNDFVLIREQEEDSYTERDFTPDDAQREHWLSRNWLRAKLLDERSSAPTLVVTHHAPSIRSVQPHYLRHRLTPCFASDLPPSFFNVPMVWIHGHMHDSCDYVQGRTRVICNPRGYIRGGRPENAAFNPRLVVTIPTGTTDTSTTGGGSS